MKIFISYRREDSQWPARSLRDALAAYVPNPSANVFMDIDNIPLGVNFAEHIEQQVSRCDVMLAVIGPQWLTLTDAEGNRRLDDPNDFVRLEIGQALRRGIPVVPVLVDAARMPRSTDLTDDLRELAMRNATEVRHANFAADADRLIQGLGLKKSSASPKPKKFSPTKREKRDPASEKFDLRRLLWATPFIVGCLAFAGVWLLKETPTAPVGSPSIAEQKTTQSEPLATPESEVLATVDAVGLSDPSDKQAEQIPTLTPPQPSSQSAGSEPPRSSWEASVLRELKGFNGQSFGGDFSSNGSQVVTGAGSDAIIWDVVSGDSINVFSGHAGNVFHAAFSRDGVRVATSSFDKTIRIWDVKTGRQLQALSGHDGGVIAAEFSPDGRTVLSTSQDNTVRLWNANTGQMLRNLGDHGTWPSATFLDSSRVVTAGRGGVRIWDVSTGEVAATLPTSFEIDFTDTLDKLSSSSIVLGYTHSREESVSIDVIDTSSGAVVATSKVCGRHGIDELSVTERHGGLIFLLCSDSRTEIRDRKANLLKKFSVGYGARGISISPDASRMYVGGDKINIWRIDAPQ